MRVKFFFYLFIILEILVVSCSESDLPDKKESLKKDNNIVTYEKIAIPFNYKVVDQRPHLKCDTYTDVQKDSLNKLFTEYVGKAKTTCGKVVSAGLFLVNMDHCIPYSFEVGKKPGYELVARYTRKGLFLTSFNENGVTHPAWGCDVARIPGTFTTVKNLGDHYANGLHCSSYVSWCLFNGGVLSYDILDKAFAANYKNFPNTVRVPLSEGQNDILPGDLIGFEGHIGIVLGVEGDYVIYGSADGGKDATSLGHGVRRKYFHRKSVNYDDFPYKFLVKMDRLY